MPRLFRVQVRIPMDSDLPRDAAVNVWHFKHDNYPPLTTAEDSANDMVDQVEEFYSGISSIFPSTVAPPLTATVYDLAQPEPRIPILARDLVLATAPAGAALPHEVAVCLTLKHDQASGESARRARGRVYIGPLYQGQAQTINGQALVSVGLRELIADQAKAAFDTGLGIEDPFLCVYSRADDEGGASLDASFKVVDRVYVDDAWDVQRRRGEGPTARTNQEFTAR